MGRRERVMRATVSKGEFIKSGNTCSIGDKGNILRHFCVHSVWPSSCLNACKWHCFSRSHSFVCTHTRKRIHSNRSFRIFLRWMIVATNFQKILFFCCRLKFYCFLFTALLSSTALRSIEFLFLFIYFERIFSVFSFDYDTVRMVMCCFFFVAWENRILGKNGIELPQYQSIDWTLCTRSERVMCLVKPTHTQREREQPKS